MSLVCFCLYSVNMFGQPSDPPHDSGSISSLRNKRPGLSERPPYKGVAIGVARRGARRGGGLSGRSPCKGVAIGVAKSKERARSFVTLLIEVSCSRRRSAFFLPLGAIPRGSRDGPTQAGRAYSEEANSVVHRPRPEVDVRGRRRRHAAVAAIRRSAGAIHRNGDRDRRTGFGICRAGQ